MKIGKSNGVKEFIRKHPVSVYYLTTFLISWGGVVLILGPGHITSRSTSIPFFPLYLATVAGPSIAGVILIGFYDGKKGYREFILRLLRWRHLPARWYAAAFLIAPVTVFASLFVLSLVSPAFLPGILAPGDNPVASMFGLSSNNRMTLVLFVIMLGLFNGLIEELGWTGFVTFKMSTRYAMLASGINIGFMWGLWHLLSNYIGSAADTGRLSLPVYIAGLLFSFLPPFRVLMTWVYHHTKSLFVAILMHASLDIFWILSSPNALTGQQRVTWYLVWAGILWGLVVIIWIPRNKKRAA